MCICVWYVRVHACVCMYAWIDEKEKYTQRKGLKKITGIYNCTIVFVLQVTKVISNMKSLELHKDEYVKSFLAGV